MPDGQALIEPLTDGLPAHDEDTPIRLSVAWSHLLLYHRREGKPAWWRYFDLRGKPLDELLDDRDAIGLSCPTRPGRRSRSSVRLTTRYVPPQEFRLDTGEAEDPTTGENYNVVAVDEDHVVIRRGADKPPPAPAALVDATMIPVAVLREALMALAGQLLDDGGRFAATRALLRREPPRARPARTSTHSSRQPWGSIARSSRCRGLRAPARRSVARE